MAELLFIVPGQTEASLEEALKSIDQLREDISSGRIIAFQGVGVGPDDQCFTYSAATRFVSRLRIFGAVAYLLHCLNEGDA